MPYRVEKAKNCFDVIYELPYDSDGSCWVDDFDLEKDARAEAAKLNEIERRIGERLRPIIAELARTVPAKPEEILKQIEAWAKAEEIFLNSTIDGDCVKVSERLLLE